MTNDNHKNGKELIDKLLKNRHNIFLTWCKPWEGLSTDKNDVSCNVNYYASVHDCINLSRKSIFGRSSELISCDRECLTEFIIDNYAYVLEEAKR